MLHVALARECIRDSRNEDCWGKVWNRIDQVASAVGTTIDKPRTARLQCHRANAGADYYRINVYFPFIDHIVKELETRFSSDHDGLVAVQGKRSK